MEANEMKAMEAKYEKFMVLYNKKGNPPNAVPWTGLDPTIDFIREKLEDGYVVRVKPFTREEWGEGDGGK